MVKSIHLIWVYLDLPLKVLVNSRRGGIKKPEFWSSKFFFISGTGNHTSCEQSQQLTTPSFEPKLIVVMYCWMKFDQSSKFATPAASIRSFGLGRYLKLMFSLAILASIKREDVADLNIFPLHMSTILFILGSFATYIYIIIYILFLVPSAILQGAFQSIQKLSFRLSPAAFCTAFHRTSSFSCCKKQMPLSFTPWPCVFSKIYSNGMQCHQYCFCLFTYLLLCQKGLSSMYCKGWYLTSKDTEFPYSFIYFQNFRLQNHGSKTSIFSKPLRKPAHCGVGE